MSSFNVRDSFHRRSGRNSDHFAHGEWQSARDYVRGCGLRFNAPISAESHVWLNARKADLLAGDPSSKILVSRWWLWRGLVDRLRKESSREHGARGKLRPEWEMDNVSYSHRCLLTEVMVVRAASVFP